jgi:hypothetical protein
VESVRCNGKIFSIIGKKQSRKPNKTSGPKYAIPRSRTKIDPVVRLALLTCNRRQLRKLYNDPRLTAREREMIFQSLMTNTRYTQIPL